MTTFTKKTVIVWAKTSYDTLTNPGTVESPSAMAVEFHTKKDEMIADGKMSEETGGFVTESVSATQFRKFVDEAAAQEWINFNSTFATAHNLTMISSEIQAI